MCIYFVNALFFSFKIKNNVQVANLTVVFILPLAYIFLSMIRELSFFLYFNHIYSTRDSSWLSQASNMHKIIEFSAVDREGKGCNELRAKRGEKECCGVRLNREEREQRNREADRVRG